VADLPNYLVFMTDQHRADWLGCAGHPLLRTPNIDGLANAGTRFSEFHVASPVCMPNRASFMTGRMPSVHGLRYNGCLLPQRANTFVDVLAQAGYRTASIGKSHLQPFTDSNPVRATDTETRLIVEAWKDDGLDYQNEQPEKYRGPEIFSFPLPYYGFQHVDMVTGHGDRCGGHYQQWFQSNCPDWQMLQDPVNELPHDFTCPQAYRTPVPAEFYPTSYVADRAVDYLREQKDSEVPFFAFVSFPDPHHPFGPPGKYWDMYHPDQFQVSLPYEAHQNPTPPMRFVSEEWAAGRPPRTLQTAFRADSHQIQQAMALTAGMISMIDDRIGQVLEVLDETGKADNTVVVFTSDHGDYLGDFNLMLKGAMPFRGITQVPMIWRDPKQPNKTVFDGLASTVDLPASILERAGLAPYRGMQGKSFLSAIAEDGKHREDLLIEFNDGVQRLGFENLARVRSLRNEEWVLTLYGGEQWGELYNIAADPNETNNLWDSPEHAAKRAELSLRLNHLLVSQMDESPHSERLA